MYYVCKNAERKKKSKFSYSDYFEAQKLDPAFKNKQEPTYAKGNWSKKSSNPYVHLSAAVGQGNFKKSGSGYVFSDVYDFNVLRGGGEKIEDYVVNSSNLVEGVKRARQLIGSKRLFAGIEELCVWYETTLGYKGFRVKGAGKIDSE